MSKLKDTTNFSSKKSTTSKIKSKSSFFGKENEIHQLYPECSTQSEGTSTTIGSKGSLLTPENFAKFVPYAFKNLTDNIHKIRIVKMVQGERLSAAAVHLPQRKSLKKYSSSLAEIPSEMQTTNKTSFCSNTDITLHAYYNSINQLVKVGFENSIIIPELIKILDMCFPFQKYLHNFVVRDCRLTQEVLFEIFKALPNSNLTEICLDDTFSEQKNYYVLLDAVSCLSRLSLNRCKIGDEVLNEISLRLESGKPASQSLKILELSSNQITDKGAETIAKFLRSNRCILHLNLAGNRITSLGGIAILNVLSRFRLDENEIMELRKTKMLYLFMNRPANKFFSGPFKNPFSDQQTVVENNQRFCKGNFNLCSLNVAYNNLDYMFIKKLNEVLIYQSTNKQTTVGLIRVVSDGNEIPLDSVEQNSVNRYLQDKIVAQSLSQQRKVKYQGK